MRRADSDLTSMVILLGHDASGQIQYNKRGLLLESDDYRHEYVFLFPYKCKVKKTPTGAKT